MVPGPEPPDRELVARAQQGDVEAFNILVLRYQDRIYNAVFRFCGNHEDASDVTQRAFINAYRKLSEFKGDAAFSTWMYRIAFNQSVSLRREGGHRRAVSIYGKDDDLVVEPEVNHNPTGRMETEESRRQVQRALLMLAAEDRRIIVLKDLEDRSYEEIAAILDVPKGTVRSRLHRARLELREKLKSFMGTPTQP
ncbi:MAG: sigma-70 family RNA polymerase sigma factor [Planctomycetes bacterium]|nr:sigma-70 family RNA polymerase sigma factor [Planctomycetota bacterium]